MPSQTSPHRAPRCAARVPLIAALLVLAGCGSSQSSTSGAPAPASTPLCPAGQAACVSQSPRAKAGGPPALDANLAGPIAQTNPTLKHLKLACPPPAGYPIHCRMAATDTAGGKSHPVAGTATVLGIDTKTRTYAYTLNYAPSR